MRPDIINAPALRNAIDELLEGAPPTLRGHIPALRAALRKAMETHESVRKARRRKTDPDWAQAKFDDNQNLYRFHEKKLDDWEIEDLLAELGEVAQIVASGGVQSRKAAAFLRGLAHGDHTVDGIRRSANLIIRAHESAKLRARRHEVLRQPVDVAAGSLIGTRCVSIEDITRLGREAQNCLADNEKYWKAFADGQTDLWSLREGIRLIAVLEVERSGPVKEVLGPANAPIGPREAGRIAAFCRAAGLRLEGAGLTVLPDFATPAVIDRRVVMLSKRVAVYSEWPTAVRIDLSGKAGDPDDLMELFGCDGGPECTLALSFDPNCSSAEEVLGRRDPREAIWRFGRKRLRRIVQGIAFGQAVPSLVQHRLLVLSA